MTREAYAVRLNIPTAHQTSLTSASLFQFTPVLARQHAVATAETRSDRRSAPLTISMVPKPSHSQSRVPQPTMMLGGVEHKGSCACHPILFIERNVDVANPAAHRPRKSRQVAAKRPTVIANPTTPRPAERWLD